MKKSFLATIIACLLSSAVHAQFMTTEFIEQHQVILAQLTTYEKINSDELMRLNVTLATEIESGIQFYLLYRPGKNGQKPRYYYLIDPNMKSSRALLDFGVNLDKQIIPNQFLPKYLVEDKIIDGKVRKGDAFSYFGEIDPIEVDLSKLKTANGYEINIDRYSFHRAGADPLGDNKTEYMNYLKEKYPHLVKAGIYPFQPAYFATGIIEAKDLMTPKERADFIAKEEINLIQRQATPEYRKAVNEVLVRVNAYISRYNAANVPVACKKLFSGL